MCIELERISFRVTSVNSVNNRESNSLLFYGYDVVSLIVGLSVSIYVYIDDCVR
jgi:hypothetical protein